MRTDAVSLEGTAVIYFAQSGIVGRLDGEVFAREALGRCIVYANDLAIRSEAKITFDGIGSHLPSQLEGVQRIFRCIRGRSAVCDNPNSVFHGSI